jgi:D-alanyl-D-alanine carboxypeptidase/D-alanyl-D-alanine-endopeptidase (penicillin-binding protein 4)
MAGYVQGQSGKWYAVVGLINADNAKNNDKAKAVLDEMLAWTATK